MLHCAKMSLRVLVSMLVFFSGIAHLVADVVAEADQVVQRVPKPRVWRCLNTARG